MSAPLMGMENGTLFHYSVGALIWRDGKILLLDRMKPPFGFAGPGGHIDEGENPEEALIREVKEETGLDVRSSKLVCAQKMENECRHGIKIHYWHLYSCDCVGELAWNRAESKSIDWYTREELRELVIEPIWIYWLTKEGIL